MPHPRVRLAAAATAGLLLLTGCFSNSGDTADSSGDDRISLAMLLPPRSGLSPFSDDAFKLSRWSTAETLVTLDADGVAQPALATAFTQTPDAKTWRFEIRDGVTFHDGTPLTVASVVAALTAATKAGPKPRILDGVDLTVRPDPAAAGKAVLVSTAEVDPLIPQRLSSPQLSILATAAYGADGAVNPAGHGTGPFKLISSNTTTAKLDRYDAYWGGPAKAAGIDVSFVPDGTARAAALRTGTADVVEAIPVSQAGLLDGGKVHEVPMPRTNTLYLNTEKGAFADPAVRAAARQAIKREPIVANVYENRADVATGLLGPALPWAAKARQPRTETAPKPVSGTEIVLATFTDRAELPEVAVQLQQQLEAAGFKVRQEVREYAQIEADALAGEFDAFILSRATVLDSGDPVAYMYSDFSCEGSFNIAQLCDPAIDAALKKAAGIVAGPERQTAIMEAEKLILQSDAAVPLLHERVIQGESGAFTGVRRDSRERTLITAGTAPA
ncbi:ABC transporter substrate-binding protein [Actinoplanes utahensis]|uniref:ABC transporter substrate-binding protein n=1 Tax=Actinoplanes utahensis TaxID=1869 RepID=A0A0A6UNX4_ACTUT|nr:ABC transporter substrate-binding protein [Actinoplanes utahensis]KHD77815.1 ABC transporter substrate-binding protein [Actinoplanes utahensis]GIF32518.1 ABC transporter substrate-binding protein [Actinoplanes utahensis]